MIEFEIPLLQSLKGRLIIDFYKNTNTKVILAISDKYTELSYDIENTIQTAHNFDPSVFYTQFAIEDKFGNKFRDIFIRDTASEKTFNIFNYGIRYNNLTFKSAIEYLQEFFDDLYPRIKEQIEQYLEIPIVERYTVDQYTDLQIIQIAKFLNINPNNLLDIHRNYKDIHYYFDSEIKKSIKPKSIYYEKSTLVRMLTEIPKEFVDCIKNRLASKTD